MSLLTHHSRFFSVSNTRPIQFITSAVRLKFVLRISPDTSNLESDVSIYLINDK